MKGLIKYFGLDKRLLIQCNNNNYMLLLYREEQKYTGCGSLECMPVTFPVVMKNFSYIFHLISTFLFHAPPLINSSAQHHHNFVLCLYSFLPGFPTKTFFANLHTNTNPCYFIFIIICQCQ